ncbi:glycosyltransferase [Neptunomonas antarctica]|uniref:Glycosyltransferase involved in cell wall bisynthesis n=1 Tax=Neptunomonas antarctica TaxID=619304 RepID=A0A1N7JDE1_9GAMM|nr:glycosyltransferase [Neptunomonas antarctica]SIS47325.1 Glycosyltransferase involved in cell wall bisynthesis [Neptunomonas antarctica]
MKVLHVITDLKDGGAEAVLYRLVHACPEHSHYIVCLGKGGKYSDLFFQEGFSITLLDIKSGIGGFLRALTFLKLVRRFKPDLIQSWMYHANFFVGVYGFFFPKVPVFWGIHHTNLDKIADPKTTHLMSNLCSKLSYKVPVSVICCGYKSQLTHLEYGYSKINLMVIPNGYDTSDFMPALENSSSIKNSILSNHDGRFVIGSVARFAPQKDHENLLLALANVKEKGVYFCCLLIGYGLVKENRELVSKISELGLENEIILLGQQNNINEIMNILDVHVTSSAFGEAFPNVICEAMACGTPCITTDVGDAGYIVEGSGWVVPSKDPAALAEAIIKAKCAMNDFGWNVRKDNARNRIVDNFCIDKMALNYNNQWDKIKVD